ncbi:hypothetical protein LOK49_LG01G02065 [Camellia lanceoleosa]|uniref:Uncharacterized protein n=1 Tax=Camellia lanceoleosa TaxID=1840588 RepID=A0ACC0J5P5_9ERIC|nr:hypothetical protein LOK49_LG01G02065 [Camellia lanceoleosa]
MILKHLTVQLLRCLQLPHFSQKLLQVNAIQYYWQDEQIKVDFAAFPVCESSCPGCGSLIFLAQDEMLEVGSLEDEPSAELCCPETAGAEALSPEAVPGCRDDESAISEFILLTNMSKYEAQLNSRKTDHCAQVGTRSPLEV